MVVRSTPYGGVGIGVVSKFRVGFVRLGLVFSLGLVVGCWLFFLRSTA